MAPKLSFEIPPVRLGLYAILTLFSLILFCLTATRLHYTNTNLNFYESYAAELIFTGLVTMIWCIFVILAMFKRFEFRFITTFLGEIVVLVILWFFWVVGAGIASTSWAGIDNCQQFEACRVLSALLAFAWLSWITLTALLIVTVLFSVANHALQQPLHGRWDPRISAYSA
ncbi:hypothetical protein D9756_007967 [Leucocoprinus leucothites]|uniref:MARVEL domain-containing protein n=1 Tax=Leucocoprinus leucothites TaxID=201217 RepID=A0A8H5FXE7_9AGAR|nr:hypothetical protein D9756_007967 [Leucoagaricus leucothites]